MKVRIGFVSNSSSSSFMCLGVQKKSLIKQLLDAEKLKKDEEGFYEDEGYGMLPGSIVNFYGNSDDWQAAGFGEGEIKELLEKMTLSEAREKFVAEVNEKLKVKLNESDVDLFSGEASSEG